MQRLCHNRLRKTFSLTLLAATALWCAGCPRADQPVHDYPTHARVEYVNECIANHGDSLTALYQCSCTIDRLASRLSYDDFVEAGTFAKYSSLPGEGGAIFRDSDQARSLAKMFRELEAEAFRSCGLKK